MYTAVYGKSDWVKPAPKVPDGVPCYFYTDSADMAREAEEAGWEPRLVQHFIATVKGSPRITAPMLAHKAIKVSMGRDLGVDVAIWMDGSMTSLVDDLVDRCLIALGNADVAFTPHPWRTCVYDEAYYSSTLERYRHEAPHILEQAQFYASIGHPVNWGLIATGFFVTRVNERTSALGEHWWFENINRSHQDQVSLPVLLRLNEERGLRWNMNCPWWTWWDLAAHGPVAP